MGFCCGKLDEWEKSVWPKPKRCWSTPFASHLSFVPTMTTPSDSPFLSKGWKFDDLDSLWNLIINRRLCLIVRGRYVFVEASKDISRNYAAEGVNGVNGRRAAYRHEDEQKRFALYPHRNHLKDFTWSLNIGDDPRPPTSRSWIISISTYIFSGYIFDNRSYLFCVESCMII